MKKQKKRIYRDYVKRLLDVTLAGLAIVVLSPVIGLIALLVRIKLGSPVVFKQVRPGMHEKFFSLYKFCSMTNEVDETGMLLPDEQRLTRFGNFLRASSLDELLELFNILRGDMSIVGPRPLSIYYLPHYSDGERRRHLVRPGLTGLAQVSGRNNLNWEDRFALDLNYVDHVSLIEDVRIIFMTLLKVVKAADISVRGTSEIRDFGPYSTIKEEGAETMKSAGMTYKEIGSYFWLEDSFTDGTARFPQDWLPEVADSAFAFSGRAAIDIALQDILSKHTVKEVLAPSYCCVSMLQPFADRGIRVRFYSVDVADGSFVYRFPEDAHGSVVLVMSYFGLSTAAERELIRTLRKEGRIVIEDITHSLLREDGCATDCDYAVASLRKWFPMPSGGWVGKRTGSLAVRPVSESDHAVAEKIRGMKEKYAYLTGSVVEKENFLALQAKFDTDLIHIDRLLKMDSISQAILDQTDVQAVRARRRSNALTLWEGLRSLDGKCLTLPQMDLKRDVPLFLPIFLKRKDRDSLRAYLVAQGMYCPIHWPEVMGAPEGVRQNELSLVCDQRYGEGDMRAMVQCILEWAQRR